MKRLFKWMAATVAVLLVAFLALFLGTRGDYPVARLVTDDPSLLSETIAGVRLHMQVNEGPVDAPVVIVLHGGPGGDFRSLQALSRLSDQFTVVFYDQRGAGLSERVSADMLTMDGHLEELAALISRVSPDDAPILIGHSWGAMLVTGYLGQNPDDVEAAVLIEPGYLTAEGHVAWQEASQSYLSGAAYWREAILTGFRAQHVDAPDDAASHDYLIGHMVGVFANNPENPYHCGAGYSAPNWRFGGLSSDTWDAAPKVELERHASNAGAYAGPVLLMAGACNGWIGEPLQREHMDLFQNARISVIPDAGHDVIWDNPNASLASIRNFLTKVATQ